MKDEAVATLQNGGVVAAATETFFGLLADARREDAIDRVYALKGRAEGKGSALLLPTIDAWRDLVVEIPELAERLAQAFWPGPLTIALSAKPGLDPRLVVSGKVGVRLPAPSDAARLTTAFGAPVTATSANRSGEPPFTTSEEVEAAFSEEIARKDLVVRKGRAPGGAASTLVVVEKDEVRLVREGAISVAAMKAVIANLHHGRVV